jgi:hypothetical protein
LFRPSPFFGTTKNSNGLNRLKSIIKSREKVVILFSAV